MSDFQVRFRLGNRAFDFNFFQQDGAKPESVHVGGHSYAILGSKQDVEWLRKKIPDLFGPEAKKMTVLEFRKQLMSLDVSELSIEEKVQGLVLDQMFGSDPSQSLKKVEDSKVQLIDQRLQSYCKERGFQGAVLVVENGQLKLETAYGLASAEGLNLSADTRFPIGSLTKPLTAMAVLHLLDEGKLGDFQDPSQVCLVDILPADCLPSDPKIRTTWESVSLQDLLNHTSGLPSFPELGEELEKIMMQQAVDDLSPEMGVIGLVRDTPLKGSSSYNYSNFGYHLLGKVIEKAAGGTSYSEFMEQFLHEQLGMENSGFATDLNGFPAAMRYGSPMLNEDPNSLDSPKDAYSSGALFSTVGDLQKLFEHMANSMPAPESKVGMVLGREWDFRNEYQCLNGWNYSLGEGSTEIWKNGAVAGFGSLMVWYPESKSGMILLSNQPRELELQVAPELANILNAESKEQAIQLLKEREGLVHTDQEVERQREGSAFKKQREAIIGAYWDTFVEIDILEKDHSLFKHFIAGCFVDPLFIHAELEEAIEAKKLQKFSAVLDKLPVARLIELSQNEQLLGAEAWCQVPVVQAMFRLSDIIEVDLKDIVELMSQEANQLLVQQALEQAIPCVPPPNLGPIPDYLRQGGEAGGEVPILAGLTLRETMVMGTLAKILSKTHELETKCIQSARANAPGSFVELGQGTSIHYQTHGIRQEGAPAVIMQSGMGDLSDVWKGVTEGLGKDIFSLAYDRPGLGFSDLSESSGNIEELVADLDEMLQKLEIEAPYVLVGHSFGGAIMQLFAARYPEKVAGVVLVDSSSAHQLQQKTMMECAKHSGYVQDFPNELLMPESTSRVLFPEARQEHAFLLENQQFEQSLRVLADAKRPFGQIPVRVISNDLSSAEEKGEQEAWQCQKNLLGLSEDTQQIVAPKGTGHYIHLKEPTLVTETIQDLLQDLNA